MTEFPGLLPWHFGGDPHLTYREAVGLIQVYDRRIKERREAQREAEQRSRGRGR